MLYITRWHFFIRAIACYMFLSFKVTPSDNHPGQVNILSNSIVDFHPKFDAQYCIAWTSSSIINMVHFHCSACEEWLGDVALFQYQPKLQGPATQAPITKTRSIKMHALDWLNERGCILCGTFKPIKCILFAFLLFSLSLQCDLALKPLDTFGTEKRKKSSQIYK